MSTALRGNVVQLDEYRWMLPAEGGMRVLGILFANRALLDKMFSDKAPEQVRNAAHLPGILEASIAMPDAHWGYGLPVGGVVATDPQDGVVSPGAVGYDIGCGVRLLRSRLVKADLAPRLDALADVLFHEVPCGVGSHGAVKLSFPDPWPRGRHGDGHDPLRLARPRPPGVHRPRARRRTQARGMGPAARPSARLCTPRQCRGDTIWARCAPPPTSRGPTASSSAKAFGAPSSVCSDATPKRWA